MRITALLILVLCTTKLQGQSANTLEQAKTAFKFETSYLNTFTGDALSGMVGQIKVVSMNLFRWALMEHFFFSRLSFKF